MQGIVKWFSSEKGYGFINGEDDADRFFGVRDIQGASLPKNGYVVEFEHVDNAKGPGAGKIKIVWTAVSQPQKDNPKREYRDDRVECPWCHKKNVFHSNRGIWK